MIIHFTPVRLDRRLQVECHGDRLSLNGATYDFSELAEGQILPAVSLQTEWIASDVARIDGEIVVTLIVPHGAKAPPETLFPQSLQVAADGPVVIPVYEA